MKTILCYGDSLTWGYNPRDGTRYAFDQRWPGVLQGELGSGFRVIEEALNGRTTVMNMKLHRRHNRIAPLGLSIALRSSALRTMHLRHVPR